MFQSQLIQRFANALAVSAAELGAAVRRGAVGAAAERSRYGSWQPAAAQATIASSAMWRTVTGRAPAEQIERGARGSGRRPVGRRRGLRSAGGVGAAAGVVRDADALSACDELAGMDEHALLVRVVALLIAAVCATQVKLP